jgi:hypothetical protein
MLSPSKFSHHHIIIGEVVFALLFFQALFGLGHHILFKQKGRRQTWSHAHIWTGRILVTLGIINGGLGMQLAGVSRAGKIAYGVLAGLIWLVWMAIAVLSELQSALKPDSEPMTEK